MSSVKEMFAGHEDELEMFNAYRNMYALEEQCIVPKADVETILKPWADNKSEFLWDLLDKQLILSKDISYKVPEDQLVHDMINAVDRHKKFIRNLLTTITAMCGQTENSHIGDILNAYTLVENSIPYSFSIKLNGKTLSFSRGQKVMRVLGKICREIGMEEDFEQFRIAHSLVLNQSRLSGKLCLSIHPLDYATASDNANGWSSCMSWEEGGSYRLGTVEMMTSPYVICAYLASENMNLEFDNFKWNSKKWRAWIIVHKDFIVVNRNYPYESNDISESCVEWVKTLAANNLGWHYDKCLYWLENSPYHIKTNFMYNDIGCCDHIGCYRKGFDTNGDTLYLNISGPAICMNCGAVINSDDVYDADSAAEHLICTNCSAEIEICQCCGQYIYTNSDGVYFGPDDQVYCENCYNEMFTTCEICSETYDSTDVFELIFPFDSKWQDTEGVKIDDKPSYTPCVHSMYVCKDCLEERNIKRSDLIRSPILNNYNVRGYFTYNFKNSYMLKPHVPYEFSAEIFNFPVNSNYFHAAWEYNNQKLLESNSEV